MTADGKYSGTWYLRLPGIRNGGAVSVSSFGNIGVYGSYDFPDSEGAVRPALVIDLK